MFIFSGELENALSGGAGPSSSVAADLSNSKDTGDGKKMEWLR